MLKDITESGGGERVGVNLANAFSANLGFCVCVVSFFKSGAKPFYPLDTAISCVYLSNRPAKGKNALINLFNKTLFRFYLCLKMRKFVAKSDIILANDGWFVPFFRGVNCDRARFFVRLWHLNAPKSNKKLRFFDALVILSGRELSLWQRLHSNIKVIPNFLPNIPQVATNHNQNFVLSVGRFSSEKGFLRLIDIWKTVRDRITYHTECSEVSKLFRHSEATKSPKNPKSHESKFMSESMTQERMGESHRFAKSQQIVGDSQVAKMDSSLTAFAQNDESVDCFGDESPRNDEMMSDLREWQLIIVGDGVLKGEIQSKIHALNLQDSIILKPFTKDIEREYLGASIYAMASHFEGFGMVLAEASSYELPCISFDIATGPSDIIENNKSGFLVADNDLQGYAEKLIALMNDESMRIRFGKEAKRIVSERFSRESALQKWRTLFGE